MTFGLVRIGWPNTVVVLALLLTPLVAMAADAKQRRTPVEPLTVAERSNTLAAEVAVRSQ